MNIIRKICVVTGTRAEYGLMYWLMKEIRQTEGLKLQLIVTGMHLSHEFGLTYKQIEDDGFKINFKVENLLSSDTTVGVSKSMGLAIIGFADAYDELQPDIIVILGDRFEMLSAASAATIARIPIAHLHGGETTEGAFDEAFRHSITKMSYIHFTATNEYRNRVIQLGEHPDRVFNVGAPGVEYIHRMSLLSRKELEKSIGFQLGKYNILVTFHPVTLESATAEIQFGNLLHVIDKLDDIKVVFTKANADTDGRVINDMIDEFVKTRPQKACVHTSLGQIRYLSAIQYMDAVVGNSSSGLIEVPSFSVGTINIGDRQLGRVRATSVIDCDSTVEAFKVLYSRSFQKKLRLVKNPHDSGDTSRRIVEILRHLNLSGILKKKFYDFL